MAPACRLGLCALLLLPALPGAAPGGQGAAARAHPLDPLTAFEMTTAVGVLRAAGRVDDATRFSLLHLHEPSKADVLSHRPGMPVRREAFAVLYNWTRNTTSEAIVDVRQRRLLSWKDVPGAQPGLLRDDHILADQILRADPGWQAAVRKRGVVDPGTLAIMGYPPGGYAADAPGGNRLAMAVTFHREPPPAGGLVEGLIALLDLTTRQVVRLEDSGVNPPRFPPGEYFDGTVRGEPRKGLKALRIASPEGGSYTVEGHEVRWQNWRFRFSFHPRVGLVLHTVAYEDGGRVRPILYRAALSEMVVPYGDPGWMFINPFDAGEINLGVYGARRLNALNDAPANARMLPAVLHDASGAPVEVPDAVALYERDGGVLWRHDAEARRARQLVLSFFTLVDNYDYGFNWVFHQDGSLEMETLLTGIMNVKSVDRARESAADHQGRADFGHLVARNIEAPNHQHFFNFRLDLDVDGPGPNTVVELNTEGLPQGAANPRGNAIAMRELPLRREQEAQRLMSMATSRRWKVINPDAPNALGHSSGYTLLPGENSLSYAAPGSFLRRKAGFVNAHLWVTPFRDEEQYAAGDYVNLGPAGAGLPKWTAADRSIENRDVVLWYTMGITHLPRPEDWPVVPVHRAGFKLLPTGFFSRNPAMDVPKATPARP